MDNIKQIRIVHKALNKQKEHLQFEVAKLSMTINNKKALIEKMHEYLKDYLVEDKFKVSKQHPKLLANFESFIKQIEGVIQKTQQEIGHLMQRRQVVHSDVKMVEKKMSLMDMFSDRIKRRNEEKAAKSEQLNIDDISLLKHMRSNYE